MAIYLGIDGGGTKTVCAVGDESRVLAKATSGGSNVVRSGEALARESLLTAIRDACASATVKTSDIRRVCVGGSGAARPDVAAFVRRVVGEIASSEVLVVGDMETTMYAAFEDGPGVIVIAGTGRSRTDEMLKEKRGARAAGVLRFPMKGLANGLGARQSLRDCARGMKGGAQHFLMQWPTGGMWKAWRSWCGWQMEHRRRIFPICFLL